MFMLGILFLILSDNSYIIQSIFKYLKTRTHKKRFEVAEYNQIDVVLEFIYFIAS